MKKIFIGVLIIVLIAVIAFTLISGIALGNVQISSLQQLAAKDKKIEEDMYNLKQMKEVTFTETIDELTKNASKLKSKREEYASLVTDSTEDEIGAIITAEKYEIEYLWVKLGNYATKNGITLKLNVLNSTTQLEDVYNLEFILNGKYAGITEFIYQIENDSTLGFKIEKFSLTPTSTTQNDANANSETKKTQSSTAVDTETLTAKFTVKEIQIDIPEQQVVQQTQPQNQTQTSENENTVE